MTEKRLTSTAALAFQFMARVWGPGVFNLRKTPLELSIRLYLKAKRTFDKITYEKGKVDAGR